MIQDISSPFKRQSVSSLDDIVKFKCNSHCECSKQIGGLKGFYEAVQNKCSSNEKFQVLSDLDPRYVNMEWSNPLKLGMLGRFDIYRDAKRGLNPVFSNERAGSCEKTSESSFIYLKLFILFNVWHDLYPKRFDKEGRLSDIRKANEAELVECRKTVYFLTEEKVRWEMRHLEKSYRNITFFRSEPMLYVTEGVSVSDDVTEMYKNVLRCIEAGLYSYFYNRYMQKTYTERYVNFTKEYSKDYVHVIRALNMNSSIQTIFVIWLVGVGVGLLVAVIDSVQNYRNMIVNFSLKAILLNT